MFVVPVMEFTTWFKSFVCNPKDSIADVAISAAVARSDHVAEASESVASIAPFMICVASSQFFASISIAKADSCAEYCVDLQSSLALSVNF